MSPLLAKTRYACFSDGGRIARRPTWVFCLLCALIWLPGYARSPAQELDETRKRRIPIEAEIVWENVNASRQFIQGIKPRRSIRYQKSVVTLQPGQSIDFLVPAHALIRVLICGKPADNKIAEIWTSNGSGLFRKQNSAVSADGQSLIAAPDESGMSVAKIRRPDNAVGPMTVAIYTSRRRVPKLLDYYQCEILNGDECVEVSDDRGGANRDYTFLPASHRKRIVINGPQRVRIESRLKYGLDYQQRQTYWVRVYVDGVLDRVLSFDTMPQRSHRNFVNDCEQLIGRREFSYLDVDYGDSVVEIETSHPIFVRIDGVGLNLCRPRHNRSFELPDWDNVEKSISIWDAPQLGPGSAGLSQFFLSQDANARPSTEPIWDPYLNQQTIRQLARDNRIPHGGLQAYMWIRALATRHYNDAAFGDDISVLEMARRLRERYTIFRDLLPVQFDTPNGITPVRFVQPRIRRPSEKKTETVVGEQHISDALTSFPKTRLFRANTGENSKLVFRPPDSLGSTVLRVIVDQTSLQQGTRFYVRFDDRPPIELVAHMTDGVSCDLLIPSRAEAALASLANTHSRYQSDFCGGPFATRHAPLPVISAATAEFVKPADVKQVELWLSSDVKQAVRMGVQYLDARKVSLSETAFFSLKQIEKAGVDATDVNSLRFAEQELGNDSLALEKLLKSHLQNFEASIQRSEQLEIPADVFDQNLIDEKLAVAKGLKEDRQWPAYIELISEIINHSTGETRNSAILARADALENAGEFFLADRERRGWLYHGEDETLRQRAFEQLMLQADDDQHLREMFSAVAKIENPNSYFETQLARHLMNNGRHRMALILLSSHEPTDETTEILLRCSFQAQWWQLFDRTVRKLPAGQEKNFWQGLKALQFGRYQRAHRLLQAGGPQAGRWLKHWQFGDEIFERLTKSDAATRLTAIGDWESWQESHPGPHTWVEEELAIKSISAASTIYSTNRGLRSHFFRVNQSKPASIMMSGPVRIRIEVRPVHESGSRVPIHDWLHVHNASQSERIPITNNYVSQRLKIEQNPNEAPGQLITTEIDLPTGLNKIMLTAERSDILFRVLRQQPEIRLPLLPPINETTLASVIKGRFGNSNHQCRQKKRSCKDCVRLICLDRECRSVPIDFLANTCDCGLPSESTAEFFEQLAFGDAKDWEDRIEPQESTFEILGVDDVYRQAVAAAYAADPASYYYDPDDRLRHVVTLEKLAKQYPLRPEIRELLARTKAGSSWSTFLQFDSRAGIYSVARHGWQPETPAVRIRKSLMAEYHALSTVVTGSNNLVFQIDDQRPTKFSISFQRPQIGFVPLGATQAILESANDVRRLTLDDPFEATVVEAEFPPGARQLEIRHGNPLANHYIATNVREVFEIHSTESRFEDRSDPDSGSRTYQVGTYDEPIRFTVAAPKLLRIDKLEDGRTRTEIYPVEKEEVLVLQPKTGSTGLYRIFELEFNDTPPPATHRPELAAPQSMKSWADEVVPAVYQEVDAASAIENIDLISLRSPDLEPVVIEIEDQHLLGTQALGTWGFESGYQKRRAFEEFPSSPVPGRFFDFRIARYRYDPWRDRYMQSELLIRPRIGSGPTYGFFRRGSTTIPLAKCRPRGRANAWGPVDLDWGGYFLNQHAGTPLVDDANSDPWILGFDARISRSHRISERLRHRPKLSFFGRFLSEDVNGFAPGELDQDIFTSYKSDHPYGLRLSDQFIYQNCLDRRWWLQPRLASNSDEWVPDNLGFQVGTDQLVGPLLFKLSYRYTGYFADNDRKQASGQNVLYFDLKYERWHNRIRRTELNFSLRNDLGDGSTSIGINLASFLNHARGYTDFQPESILFRAIREERAAKHYWCIQ